MKLRKSMQRSLRRHERGRAFTIVEVMVALAIFAMMSVVLTASYLNILSAYQSVVSRPRSDLDLRTARNALLAQSDYDTAQKGDQFDGASGRHVIWSAVIDPTTTADLFQVTFTCELTGGADANSSKDETITEIFRVLRPTWSQGDDSNTLRQAAKDRLTQILQPSPLSGIGAGGGGGGVMGSGGSNNGKKSDNGKNGSGRGGSGDRGNGGNGGQDHNDKGGGRDNSSQGGDKGGNRPPGPRPNGGNTGGGNSNGGRRPTQ